MQCEYVCIELKNANAYVPMLYVESPAPSAAGDSIYGADNQEILVCAGCPIRLETAFFKVIIYQFTPVMSSVVETSFKRFLFMDNV